ncbi:MAG: protein BatD [Bacteroidales bacterium]|nr:protein BatD [Bacteroidales bacterium]
MKKSGIYILFLLLFGWQWAQAADNVRFTASAPEEVAVGQQFQIVFQVNGNGKGFTAPDFKGLTVLSGPNTSTSSSLQFINGKMSQSYTITFSYIVMAEKTGTFYVQPAIITVDGKQYRSDKLQIDVVKGSPRNNPAGNPGQRTGTSGTVQGNNGQITAKDVFVKATVNNAHPYMGQQVVVTYKIYTRVPVSNLAINKVSSFKGFWSQDLLSDNARIQQSNETIDGQQYVVAVIRKLALIPQQVGKLTIDPMQLNCVVQLRVQRQRSGDPFDDFFNDPFFNQNVKNINKTLVANAVHIDVKPLPEAGKPACFSGAVGDFKFETSVDKTSLSTNDALTYTINLTGRGNIELIDAPKVGFPSDFETYDPKIVDNTIKTDIGISGSKKFEYLAIPRNPGDFTIDPVKFCYFNPADKKYHTLTSPSYKIHVVKGKGGGNNMVYTGNAQEDIQFLGKDIRHIESGPYNFVKVNTYLFGSVLFYILMLIPVVLLIVALILRKVIENRKANVSLLKNRKANKVARTKLMKAQKIKKTGNDKAFYDEIALALWGYIADKFDLKQSDLSMDSVREKLEQRQVAEETITGFISTLNNIEYARFAPGNTRDKMENIYAEALSAIMQAEKSLK